MKLSRTVSKVWSGHEFSTSDGRTDGRTDTQKFGGYNIIPRHFLWRDIKGEYLWQYLMHSALKLISTFLYGKETVYQISSSYVKTVLEISCPEETVTDRRTGSNQYAP